MPEPRKTTTDDERCEIMFWMINHWKEIKKNKPTQQDVAKTVSKFIGRPVSHKTIGRLAATLFKLGKVDAAWPNRSPEQTAKPASRYSDDAIAELMATVGALASVMADRMPEGLDARIYDAARAYDGPSDTIGAKPAQGEIRYTGSN